MQKHGISEAWDAPTNFCKVKTKKRLEIEPIIAGFSEVSAAFKVSGPASNNITLTELP